MFEARDVAVQLLGRRRGRGRLARRVRAADHRADRSVGLRQEHVPAHVQPHERPDRRRARSRASSRSTVTTSTRPTSTRSRCAAGSAWCSRSRTRSRSRSTTTSRSGRASTAGARASTRSSSEALRQAALWDEVKDKLKRVGVRALGRPAAAALHRALPRGRARRDPDGRAVLGARPDRDVAHRRSHGRSRSASTRS